MIALLESDFQGEFICHRCQLVEHLESKILGVEVQLAGLHSSPLVEFQELSSLSFKELPLQELDLALDPESGSTDEPLGTQMATSSRKREFLIVGDSILRGVDNIVCLHDKEFHTVCCLPGAQVGDLLECADKLLARAGRDPVVMVRVGTNDMGKGRFEVLQGKFAELADKIRSRTFTVVFSGILPVPRASRGKHRFIWRFNTWLQSFCRKEGYRFMGHWDSFWDRGDLYRWDGLHLNQRGIAALGQRMLRVAQDYLN
ncbi:hypothetical protein SKAU_G00131860 [Synaphobranchus kaupii]|uniref:SGNH hydrolase-type esterase domain-containing protein n=1 Tax=Synaphobranchus kaupii TaxID=118154 RepID=A0A9Q1J3J9_SYNKA|nr:hypothetical protein SKAU_G00131860 [Synaphobranchus kaupii]